MTVDTRPNINVLIVGDVMIDEYVEGTVDRISPEAPVPILRKMGISRRPGGAANVARNVSALAHRPILIGATGRHELFDAPAYDKMIFIDGRVPTVKTRFVANGQQIMRMDDEVTNDISVAARAALVSSALREIRSAAVVIISDYAKGSVNAYVAGSIIEEAGRQGIKVIVDSKRTSEYSTYRGAFLLTPNEKEFREAKSHMRVMEGDILRDPCSYWGVDNILETAGDRGMFLHERPSRLTHYPAMTDGVVDVTGAGDTVVAAIACVLADGGDLDGACNFASRAAAVVVKKRGVATASISEIAQVRTG